MDFTNIPSSIMSECRLRVTGASTVNMIKGGICGFGPVVVLVHVQMVV